MQCCVQYIQKQTLSILPPRICSVKILCISTTQEGRPSRWFNKMCLLISTSSFFVNAGSGVSCCNPAVTQPVALPLNAHSFHQLISSQMINMQWLAVNPLGTMLQVQHYENRYSFAGRKLTAVLAETERKLTVNFWASAKTETLLRVAIC